MKSKITKSLFLTALMLFFACSAIAQVSINTDASPPDPSAMLDVSSTAKGVLVPRMTAAQRDAISSPATGLMIFCTDNKQYYYNAGTPAAKNWILLNSQWLSNGTNLYYNSGNVGIGTTSPGEKLTIFNGVGENVNTSISIVAGDEHATNQSILYMGTPFDGLLTNSFKTAIIAQGAGYWSTARLHFCLNNSTTNNKPDASVADARMTIMANGNVGIGTTSPTESAALDVTSTTKGFLPPRMTTAQRDVISSLVAGLTIYNTSKNCNETYNGYAWVSNTHYIGESYGGGIVFYVYDNGQHGLIAATADQSTGIRWYGGSYTNTRARADGVGAGLKNTSIIIANQGPVDGNAFAAAVCNEYSITVGGVTYGDWYLPSKKELNLLYLQKNVVGGFASDYYWSSSETSANNAWAQYFSIGGQPSLNKVSPYYVRAVRAF